MNDGLPIPESRPPYLKRPLIAASFCFVTWLGFTIVVYGPLDGSGTLYSEWDVRIRADLMASCVQSESDGDGSSPKPLTQPGSPTSAQEFFDLGRIVVFVDVGQDKRADLTNELLREGSAGQLANAVYDPTNGAHSSGDVLIMLDRVEGGCFPVKTSFESLRHPNISVERLIERRDMAAATKGMP